MLIPCRSRLSGAAGLFLHHFYGTSSMEELNYVSAHLLLLPDSRPQAAARHPYVA
jgi:hypothetical protein